jgi:hypothetical protein
VLVGCGRVVVGAVAGARWVTRNRSVLLPPPPLLVVLVRQVPGQLGDGRLVMDVWSPRPRRGIGAGSPYAQFTAAIWRRASAIPSGRHSGARLGTVVVVTAATRMTYFVVVIGGGSPCAAGAVARATP